VLLHHASPLGGVIGPNLGGIIVDQWSWRFVFYVNVPIGIAVMLVTWYRRETRTAEPAIDTTLLKHMPFLAANANDFMFGAGVFGHLLSNYLKTERRWRRRYHNNAQANCRSAR
jgi:MFS family permease